MWGLARTARGDEAEACADLERFTPYAPRLMETKVVRGRKLTAPSYLFPGYLFVPLCDAWKEIRASKFVKQLFTQNENPIPIRDEEIARIRSWEGRDGFVYLKEKVACDAFRVGERVRVTKGPLIGLFGLYNGQDAKLRERVLMHMLGRVAPVALPIGSIVRA